MSAPYSVAYSSYNMPAGASAKGNQYPAYGQYDDSHMECDETMSHASGVPSGYSGTSAGYMGGSASEYDSTQSASGVDFQEYMQDRFATSFNPIPLDRSMAVQAQT